MRTLVIGGIEVPLRASYDLTQTYDPVPARSRNRMMNGSLKQQTSFKGLLETTISGTGDLPAGLNELDFDAQVTIKCIAERTHTSVSNVISVPSNRRSDYGVEGRALVGGVWQSTAVSMSVDTATLTVVPGATHYQAVWWPELVCYVDEPSETRDARKSRHAWSIKAYQIEPV